MVEVVQVEEIEPLSLPPRPRRVGEQAEDVFLVGRDEPGQGRVGRELLADAQLGVHLRPIVVDAERVQVLVPPPLAHLLELLPADLEGVSPAEDILKDVPREEPVLAPLDLLRLRGVPRPGVEPDRGRVGELPLREEQHAGCQEVEPLELDVIVQLDFVFPRGVVQVEVSPVLGQDLQLAADGQRPAEDRERLLLVGTLLVQPLGEVRSSGRNTGRHDHFHAEDGERDRAVGAAFLGGHRAQDLSPPRLGLLDRAGDQVCRRAQPARRLDRSARDQRLRGEADELRRRRPLDDERADEERPGLGTDGRDRTVDAADPRILARVLVLHARRFEALLDPAPGDLQPLPLEADPETGPGRIRFTQVGDHHDTLGANVRGPGVALQVQDHRQPTGTGRRPDPGHDLVRNGEARLPPGFRLRPVDVDLEAQRVFETRTAHSFGCASERDRHPAAAADRVDADVAHRQRRLRPLAVSGRRAQDEPERRRGDRGETPHTSSPLPIAAGK